jgi:periplasmic divalent cation tolerance protein
MTDKIIVFSTCGSSEEAHRVARALVEARLAACVNIGGPVESVYRWQGAIETAQEWNLTIKSRRDLFPKVQAELARSHSYEVPEVLALPVVDGSEGYLSWLDAELL